MSWRLWFDLGRSFPRAPLVVGFALRQDFVISIVLVGALLLSTIGRRSRWLLAVSVVLTVVLVVLDQTRLQPWVYQYAIMLSLLAFTRAEPVNQKAILAANQIVVAMLYFWSGLQKLSWSFVHEVAPALVESAGMRLSPRYLSVIAVTIVIFETSIGIGLLFRRTRRVAVVLACFMHASILFTFILSGHNTVIWPWNVAMMIVTVLLFRPGDDTPFKHLLHRSRNVTSHLPKVAMLVCGLLPALSFGGWWDLYLSGALYSGKSPIAVMRISEGLRDRLPSTAKNTVFQTTRGEFMLPFYEWSLSDLNVPPYPEPRAYRQIVRQLCTLDTDLQTNALIIKGRPTLLDGNYNLTLTPCATLPY